jgi:hypothetical protein
VRGDTSDDDAPLLTQATFDRAKFRVGMQNVSRAEWQATVRERIAKNAPRLTEDGRFPAQLDREYEEQLLDLCASGDVDPEHWRHHGPAFFMAGLAVMVASVPEFDRRSLLDLAEALHEGSSQVRAFSLWLERSPVRPSRFLPMLESGLLKVR